MVLIECGETVMRNLKIIQYIFRKNSEEYGKNDKQKNASEGKKNPNKIKKKHLTRKKSAPLPPLP